MFFNVKTSVRWSIYKHVCREKYVCTYPNNCCRHTPWYCSAFWGGQSPITLFSGCRANSSLSALITDCTSFYRQMGPSILPITKTFPGATYSDFSTVLEPLHYTIYPFALNILIHVRNLSPLIYSRLEGQRGPPSEPLRQRMQMDGVRALSCPPFS